MPNGLRSRLLLLVLVALALAVGISLYNRAGDRTQMAARAKELAHQQTLDIARRQRQMIDSTGMILATIATSPTMVEPPPEECEKRLRELLTLHDRFANLGLISAEDELLCSAGPPAEKISAVDEAYLRDTLAKKNGLSVSAYQPGGLTEQPVVLISYPIKAGVGSGQVLFATLKLSWLSEGLSSGGIDDGHRLILVNRLDQLVASAPPTAGISAGDLDPIPEPVRRAASTASSGAVTVQNGQEGEWLYTWASVFVDQGQTELRLYHALSLNRLMAPVAKQIRQELLSLALSALLVAAVLTAGLEILVRRPLRVLQQLAYDVSRGELHSRSGLRRRKDEIGDLARAFDVMTTNLHRREREANVYRDALSRTTRLYAVLSSINSAVVRIQNQDALLTQVCRIAVDQGGFTTAWIGLADNSQTFRRIWQAHSSANKDLSLPGVGSLIEDDAMMQAAVEQGTALSWDLTSQAIAGSEIQAQAREQAIRACAVVPLRIHDETVGVMLLLADHAEMLRDKEFSLVKEMGDDVSFALTYQRKTERLEYLAYHDQHTGLPTMELLRERLVEALRAASASGGQVGLLMVGLDRLRQVSASRSRHVADQLIIAVANRMLDALPGTATASRMNTEEFAILIPAIADRARLDSYIHLLLESLSLPFPAPGGDVFLLPRIAATLGPVDGRHVETLIQNASTLLGVLRHERRETYRFFTAEDQARVLTSLEMHHAMQVGLDSEEFHLVYQPIMDVSSGRPVGVEALIRWESSVLGRVSPVDFIPVAEESGLIGRLGLWVLDTGFAQLRRWEIFGDGGLYMSLNVSPRQLLDPRFEAELEKRLHYHGVDTRRHRVSLEITETAFMTDLERGQRVVKRLRELGLQIHLDDFGTGYSSLGYLKRLPVDSVKADLSFVKDIDTDPDSEALTRAIVAMSHSLGLTTVAEGVETENHLEKLRKLGCDYAQGYYFAKPMPADEATAWLQQRLTSRTL